MAKSYTFYSYKGGSGRSTTAINTVNHLHKVLQASPEHPILIVDADVESAGLTYFFKLENKFTNYFDRSIHTIRMFTDESRLAKSRRNDTIFSYDRDEVEETIEERPTIIAALRELGVKQEDIENCFYGIKLFVQDITLLSKIIDEYNPASIISRQYDILELIRQLLAKNDVEEKRKTIEEFLPARRFVDISDKFEDCAPGTIRFLGVDVKHQAERILNSSGHRNIDAFINLCTSYNYAAVVFDSSAGVQSTAHAFNMVSDVMVYCMRPTNQFIRGTRNQLLNYSEVLSDRSKERTENNGGKVVILLPTAVPPAGENAELSEAAFKKISGIAEEFSGIIDNKFCTQESSLNEVGLFKWSEEILFKERIKERGSKADELSAYETYKAVAKTLVDLSGSNFLED